MLPRLEHRYGPQFHLIGNPYTQTLLAKLSRPDVFQPALNAYVEELYRFLLAEVVRDLFPLKKVEWDTRMKVHDPQGVFRGEVTDQKQPAVVVDLARAGTWPSHVCFHQLNYLMDPALMRQDHFYIQRKVNAQGQVVGVDVSGSKIGGGQEGAVVLFPDPMGATGGSLCHCLSHYKSKVQGKARAYAAMHLIVTPEYVLRLKREHPDVQVYALRLDRGLSEPEVLNSIPGTYPDKEKGLNAHQYIVPGAGGVGEILNNSFV